MVVSSSSLVIKDAFWQILGRIISAGAGFVVITIVTGYLGDLRFGDYGTIMAYFAFRSSLSDLGLYVLGLKELGKEIEKPEKHQTKQIKTITQTIDNHAEGNDTIVKKCSRNNHSNLTILYSKVVLSRLFLIVVVYLLALGVAYLLPAYSSNPYLIRGLPLGMFFSATFMSAGIIQLPLQLYHRMKDVSISLVLARILQIIALLLLVFVRYPKHTLGQDIPLTVFLLVFGTVCLSSIVQFCYTWIRSQKFLRLQWVSFLHFTWETVRDNWKYGVGFFLSSAPMLFVVIILSQQYPTIQGYHYTGIWTLAIQLISILLVIPPALGNSLLHKVANFSLSAKQTSFGKFLELMIRIGLVIIVNTRLFAPQVIHLIAGPDYLSTTSIWSVNFWQHLTTHIIGSDIVLMFLTIVLLLSFVKQVYVYLFVATDKQNILFIINLVSMLIGSSVGIFLISKYNILGGIMTQLLFELLFVTSAWYSARKYHILPHISWNHIGTMSIITIGIIIGGVLWFRIAPDNIGGFIGKLFVTNTIIMLLSWKYVRHTAKRLLG